MKWEFNEIKIGDAVRVNMGMYYHYGICTAEDRIVQFGLPTINLNPEEVEVCATDIKTFLSGKFAEVMVLSKKELKQANDVKTTIQKAESSIGEKGYNIIHNNCEHFVNRCVFNNHESSQVEDVEKLMHELINAKEIYVAPVKMFLDNETLPKYTRKELKKVTNQSLKDQKISAYGLLKYAVEKSFKKVDDFKTLKKTKTGKPVAQDYKFSISHTDNLVAVVVSKCNVGVDLEKVNHQQSLELLKNSMRAPKEIIDDDVYAVWTKKESIFKFKDGKYFDPKGICADEINTKTFEFKYQNMDYVLSVASSNVNNVKIIKLFD